MRPHSFGLAFVACLLASSSAFANATVTLQVDGEPVQINDTDPAAVSDIQASQATNTTSAGTAEGAADSTAGTLRCDISSTALTNGAEFPLCTISIGDTITIHGPAGSVPVLLTLHVDGSLLLTPHIPSSSSNIGMRASVEIDDDPAISNATVTFFQNTPVTNDAGGYSTSFAPDDAGTDVGALGSPDATISTSRVVTVESKIEIGASLFLVGATAGEVGDRGHADFGNTARLTMTLPDGYTFTSESGNFLTQEGTPGLALPPDGGTGVHGAPDAGLHGDAGGSSSGGGDASIGGGSADAGGNGNGDATGAGDDGGGCNAAATSSGYGGAFALVAFVILAARRRRSLRSFR